MIRSISKIRIFFALALVAGAAACDSASELTAPVERPEAFTPQYAHLIGTTETLEIGPRGGTISIGPHYLYVLPGAVSQPTRFTMEIIAEGQYGVGASLSATRDGEEVDFRDRGVILSLFYGDIPEAVANENNLTLVGPGVAHAYVDHGAKRVNGLLSHFSDFIIADL